MTNKEFSELKQKIKGLETLYANVAGAKSASVNKLVELGFNNLSDAKDYVAKLEKEVTELKEKTDNLYESLNNKVNNIMERVNA